MKVRVTFTEPLLGTLSGNKELATEFIASKHPSGEPQADETKVIESLDESLEKASTIFPRENGKPLIWDYQIKGFFKSACLAMIETDTMTKEELKKVRLTQYLYKRTIDKMIFVQPRVIILTVPGDARVSESWVHEGTRETGYTCQRPLRGETMRGERIALARSEMLPPGTHCELSVICLNKKLEQFIPQWLTYGALCGMLQWRSSGMGRFSWQEVAEQ